MPVVSAPAIDRTAPLPDEHRGDDEADHREHLPCRVDQEVPEHERERGAEDPDRAPDERPSRNSIWQQHRRRAV